MQRVEKTTKISADTPQRQPAAGRAPATAASSTFIDQRPDAIAQRQLLQLIARSPSVDARRASGESIHNSPRMVVQRQQLRGIFSGAVQLQAGLEDEEPVHGRRATAQRQTVEEEEEPLQGRFETVQRQGAEEEELQMKAAPAAPTQLEADSPPPPNRTGLPDGLKTGIESLSGMAMDHVRVHYNSSQPAQLNALAYAQGSDIHVAPGQERHLPHEAWHVVQQAQGRVRPTMQMKDGVAVNDDQGLEREANVMRAKSVANASLHSRQSESALVLHSISGPAVLTPSNGVVSRVRNPDTDEEYTASEIENLFAAGEIIVTFSNQYSSWNVDTNKQMAFNYALDLHRAGVLVGALHIHYSADPKAGGVVSGQSIKESHHAKTKLAYNVTAALLEAGKALIP